MNIKFYLITLLAGASISETVAQNARHEFSIKSDNDAYLANGQDRYYTNGLFITYRGLKSKSPKQDSVYKSLFELSLGQKMYTSHSGYVYSRRYVDRSITAYLFAGASVTRFYSNEKIIQLGIQIGTIGPAALGRQIQEGFHRLTHTYAPNCWKYQLNNELGINMNFNYTKIIQRSPSKNTDLLWNCYANLGNTFTGCGANFTLRTGKLKPLFQSCYTHSTIGKWSSTEREKTSELFLFAKPQLDWIGYDATISGGLFRKNKGPILFQSKPWVLSQELGFMFSRKRFGAQISYIFKSQEVKGNPLSDRYGSITTFFRPK